MLPRSAIPCCGGGSGAPPLSQADLATAKDDINELVKSYIPDRRLIGTAWWQSAVALSTLETYEQVSGDTSHDFYIANAFHTPVNSNPNFENSFMDDTGWWGLAAPVKP